MADKVMRRIVVPKYVGPIPTGHLLDCSFNGRMLDSKSRDVGSIPTLSVKYMLL